jgi:hypothetical protein
MLTTGLSEPLALLSKFYANDICSKVERVPVTQTSESGTELAVIQECVTVYERGCTHALSPFPLSPVFSRHRGLPSRLAHDQLIVSK